MTTKTHGGSALHMQSAGQAVLSGNAGVSPVPVSTVNVKEANTRLVYRTLRSTGTATGQEISRETGLSIVTVNAILQDFVTTGIAIDAGQIPSNGGRPAREYRFNERQSLVLAVFTREIGGINSICVRLADLHGAVIESFDEPLRGETLAAIEAVVDPVMERNPAVRAISFGLPGIELDGSIVALDYPDLVGVSFVSHFERRYDCVVLFENDVNAAVYGRSLESGAAASEAYLYFPAKYPPGAGIRIDGRIIKGRRNFAGEVGRLPLDIPWGDAVLIESFDRCVAAVARVIASITAVIAPESVVLFGEFLTGRHLAAVIATCTELLPEGMVPALSLADDFSHDFERGLVGLALATIIHD